MADLSSSYDWKSIFLNETVDRLDTQLDINLNKLDTEGWEIFSVFPSRVKPGGHEGLIVIARRRKSAK